jgi:hypothetical protein
MAAHHHALNNYFRRANFVVQDGAASPSSRRGHGGKPQLRRSFALPSQFLTLASRAGRSVTNTTMKTRRITSTDNALVTKILKGEREITVDLARTLARQFNVDASLFLRATQVPWIRLEMGRTVGSATEWMGVDGVGQGDAGSPGSDGASPYLPNRARHRSSVEHDSEAAADTPIRRYADTPTRFPRRRYVSPQRAIKCTLVALIIARTWSFSWRANSSHAWRVSRAVSVNPQSSSIRQIGPSRVRDFTIPGS